ncbi:MAG: hypothetical protein U5R49_03490 [Deltaproteobacteria bacterium]|nr:hypothetical protein [Deltaproteobacteria bacterium]
MALQSYEAIYIDGKVNWLNESPGIKKAKVIVTILEQADGPPTSLKHKPSARIAGKGRILGDIMSPAAPVEEWNCAK